MLDLIIIGSGPYGISLAAHAAAHGLSYKLLGYPMDFWKNQMPQNMFIRTPHELVNFSDPRDHFTLQQFSKETGTKVESPLLRTIFVQYASWFVEKTGVLFTSELVSNLRHNGKSFSFITEKGNAFEAKNIVIATGIGHFKYIPEIFKDLPENLISHTSGYTSFEQFRGKDVIVLGSGQSAWEAAALLREEEANVELVYRRNHPAFIKPNKTQEQLLRFIGNVFYKLPLFLKKQLRNLASDTVPIAEFLRPYVEGKVLETGNVNIVQAEPTTNGKVKLSLSDGSSRIVDHVISASGYRINMNQIPFLTKELLESIEREDRYPQYPLLNESFESSMPGLYFAGPLSSHSHGPTFRFILGLRKTCRSIIPAIAQAIAVNATKEG